ncbi:hypothetical protein GCM10010405_18960 [Streptomyces macrosporus]|uniref:Uncharacterized protein n=1 Tax=Streptomyces macrosporus TaxID=44032 RepID=A0ABN3JRZ4_9ACTN
MEVLHLLQGGVDVPELVGQGGVLAVVAHGEVEGAGHVAVAGHLSLDDLLHRHAHELGQLLGGGGAAQPAAQFLVGPGQFDAQFLEAARNAHGPAGVPEEALDLPDDVGDGERGELHLPVQVEPVDGLDQPDGADLDDVVHRLGPVAETGRDVVDEGEVEFDEGVARVLVLVRALLQLSQALEEQLGELSGVARGDLARVLDSRQIRGGPLLFLVRQGVTVRQLNLRAQATHHASSCDLSCAARRVPGPGRLTRPSG